MAYSWYDWVGNVGVAMLLLAYLSLQLNKITSADLIYSVLNALGATLIMISLIFEFNVSAFAIEFFWLLISLVGFYKYYKAHRKAKPNPQTAD